MPKINKILELYLSLDESLVGGDKIVWPSSFLISCHDSGRGCRITILRDDYYSDSWSEQVGQTTWSISRARRCRQFVSLCSREADDALSTWSETLLE